MVLRFNKSLKYRELIPTPDCSGPDSTFGSFYSEYSTPPMSLTMPEKIPVCWIESSCQQKFTSDSSRPKHIKLYHPEQLQVAKNLTVCRAPRRIESAQRRELNSHKDSIKDLDVFPYLEHIENIADSETQPPRPPVSRTETYPGAGALLRDHIGEP